MSAGIDKREVAADLAPEWVDGLAASDRAEAGQLLAELVQQWADEADQTPNPGAVLRFQKEDLQAAGRGKDAAGRLQALRLLVLRRKVDRLGAATFALGVAILDGKVVGDAARTQGRALLKTAEALGPLVKALPTTPEAMPVRRELGDAMMEALFAVEGKAMSARLDRERASRASQ